MCAASLQTYCVRPTAKAPVGVGSLVTLLWSSHSNPSKTAIPVVANSTIVTRVLVAPRIRDLVRPEIVVSLPRGDRAIMEHPLLSFDIQIVLCVTHSERTLHDCILGQGIQRFGKRTG